MLRLDPTARGLARLGAGALRRPEPRPRRRVIDCTGRATRTLLLPADPDDDAINFDDPALSFLDSSQPDSVVGGHVPLLPSKASAGRALFHLRGSDPATNIVALAIYRSGAVEVVQSDRQAWYQENGQDYLRLLPLVQTAGLALWVRRRIVEAGVGTADEPHRLSVTAAGARGGAVGFLAVGWEDPRHSFDLPTCPTPDLDATLTVPSLPTDADGLEDLVIRIGTRIENAFGYPAGGRHINRTGSASGRVGVDLLR